MKLRWSCLAPPPPRPVRGVRQPTACRHGPTSDDPPVAPRFFPRRLAASRGCVFLAPTRCHYHESSNEPPRGTVNAAACVGSHLPRGSARRRSSRSGCAGLALAMGAPTPRSRGRHWAGRDEFHAFRRTLFSGRGARHIRVAYCHLSCWFVGRSLSPDRGSPSFTGCCRCRVIASDRVVPAAVSPRCRIAPEDPAACI